MKRLLPLVILIFIGLSANAQPPRHWVWDGLPRDSSAFSFSVNDSLDHLGANGCLIDTSGCRLWRIGPTIKRYSATSGTISREV